MKRNNEPFIGLGSRLVFFTGSLLLLHYCHNQDSPKTINKAQQLELAQPRAWHCPHLSTISLGRSAILLSNSLTQRDSLIHFQIHQIQFKRNGKKSQ
ncbi:hypothetical protein XELAEV_18001672mg [Xenopus laevis]|uniref:Uncharacterized protein n=1 Tax=Xenopus laevis TaxID=8355 RepID=A0A974BPB7_XENLA|nr:hypothetical protein XELAEV_18001672mg [Xenopus laevis]